LKIERHKIKIRLIGNFLLMSGLCIALLSRGNSWTIPPSAVTVSVFEESKGFDTQVMCEAFKDGLLSTGLVLGLHASLQRDENDYQMMSTSLGDDGLIVNINEQRQFILYFGKASAGYEITMPDPEFIADITDRIVDKDGLAVVDKLDTTVFITRLDELSDQVALEAMTSSPFLSTVVKVIPLSSFTNLICDKTGTLGLGTDNASAGLDIGKTGKTSKAAMLRSIYVQRSISSLFVVMWLMSLWLTRKSDDVERTSNG
jgi:hypothetical protein